MDVLKGPLHLQLQKAIISWFHSLSMPKTQPHADSLLRGLPTSLKYIPASAGCEDEAQVSSVYNSEKTRPLKSTCQPASPDTGHTWASQYPNLPFYTAS